MRGSAMQELGIIEKGWVRTTTTIAEVGEESLMSSRKARF